MAKIRITQEDLEVLKIKSDIAYSLLEKALNLEREEERKTTLSSAQILYEKDLGGYIRKITSRATNKIERLNKGGVRTRKLEKFILQQILMAGEENPNPEYKIEIEENPCDEMGGLKAFLDKDDNPEMNEKPEEGIMYRIIRNKARRLRDQNKYDEIFRAMTYVREKN